MSPPSLYVVHCVDTEGPLYESLEGTFERLKEIYDQDLDPNVEVLRKLQAGTYDLGSDELAAAVAQTVDPAHLNYMDTWGALDAMLHRLDAPEVRLAQPDSDGNGWLVNWHCLAHHGYDSEKNPRRRDLGIHSVFDHYRDRYADNPWGDSIHWHLHPVPRTRQANHSATSYVAIPTVLEIISRRILERHWFPCVNRPGFHAERPDSHCFLEQWMPFDIANTNMDNASDQADIGAGRFGDWRRAPKDWVVYHPHHDDYQRAGSCRRAIARCLYLGGRAYRIDRHEVEKAFARSRRETVIMAFFNHDYRDVVQEIAAMQGMLSEAQKAYPDVTWRFADAADAMRAVLGMEDQPHSRFDLRIGVAGRNAHVLNIRLDRAPFGPQPWFCYALKDGTVWHDNLDFGLEPNHWSYTFDEQTAPLGEISLIGVATNTKTGRTTVTTLDPVTGKQQTAFHN